MYFSFYLVQFKDCDLYATSYAIDLAAGINPSDIIYDQNAMRSPLSMYSRKLILIFSLHWVCPDKSQYINCTRTIATILVIIF